MRATSPSGAPPPPSACPSSRRCATAPATSRTTRSPISTSISRPTSARCVESGGHVHYAAGRRGGAPDHRRPLPGRSARRRVTKGKSMISEEIGLNAGARGGGHRGGRDRPRRIHHPAARRDAVAHHRAGDPPDQGATSRQDFRKAHRDLPPDRDLSRARAAARRGARRAARQVPRRRRRHHRREFPRRRDRHLDHRHQRGQRRPDADPAARSHIVIASLEKIVPTLEDAAQLLRVLARSATGQDMSVYTTLLDRPAPAGRSRRPGGISRRPPRQRPLVDARRRIRGHAALHPLRRLHEPLPGLSGGRRPRLRLGLSRARWARC